jgi:large subunit ribosomal protein L3
MALGLIGKKVGMTQVYTSGGELVPVTVIKAGPCTVVQLKSKATDGYAAVQLGFGDKKAQRATKAYRQHCLKVEKGVFQVLREFRLDGESGELTAGQEIGVEGFFKTGDRVDVTGLSKGRGYAGVIKRHGFSGFPGSHGTHEYFRHGGSIGCRLTPQRVHKGKRMAGQMGNEKVSVQNLQLFRILADENCILVRGSVPGSANDYVVVTKAATRTAYRRKGVGKEEVRSKNPLKASKKAAAGR